VPKTIPAQLLDNIRQDTTTLCVLIRVDPVQPGYASYGAALLDHPVPYDDGDGELVYQAIIGGQPSTLVFGADLSVDGGTADNLLPEFDVPISEADIVAGAYDFARFTAYKVDYRDLSAGHEIIAHGTLGRFTVNDDGLSFTKELRGLTQSLKQSLTEKWSLGCRATFGSQSVQNSDGSAVIERYPCNFDADSLWEAGTVDSVGLETNRTFVTSGLAPPYGGEPGMVRWITGANTGRTYEAEAFTDVAGVQTIDLTFPTMFPIQIGDTFDFRDDCPKTKEACIARSNFPNYRGEPDIPVADAGQIAAPGASAGVGTGATITTEYAEE
jgi:uncharacterized phage protein (TIGR02218 family)